MRITAQQQPLLMQQTNTIWIKHDYISAHDRRRIKRWSWLRSLWQILIKPLT